MPASAEIRIAVFLIASAALGFVSRQTILRLGSHGFYRFIAWEAILGLVLWNLPHWFSEPFSPMQILSWMLLVDSLFVLWFGVSQLMGAKRSASRTERELYAFERTAELVTTGIYRFIRHPLYASLLYLAWGAFFKDISWLSIILNFIASAALFATAVADERECLQYFGEAYADYMRHTKRFIPYLL